MARSPSGLAYHSPFPSICPVMVCGPSSERSVGGPVTICLFCFICPPLRHARPAYHFPCCSILSVTRGGQLIICAARAGQFIIRCCGAPRPVLKRAGNALLFHLEWSRTPSPRCPRPPNAHALRSKLWRVKWSLNMVNFERRIASMHGMPAGQPLAAHWLLSCQQCSLPSHDHVGCMHWPNSRPRHRTKRLDELRYSPVISGWRPDQWLPPRGKAL